MNKIYNHWNICNRNNRVVLAQKKLAELNAKKFDDKDLRGLSNLEKEFVKKNNFKITFSQYNIVGKKVNYFLLIKRNNLNKKELFAITKKQSLMPNEQDVCKGILNHQILLKFSPGEYNFSIHNFEKNFSATTGSLKGNILIHLF